MDDYAKEKLDFVSNLNGTSLTYMVSLAVLFPMINLFSVMLKMFLLFCVSSSSVSKNSSYYWKSFLIDYLFCLMPLLCVVTILAEYISVIHYILCALLLLMYKSLEKKSLKAVKLTDASEIKIDSVEEKVVRLSISTCRLWLYLLTCVTILAVDFKVYPRFNAKTENYGISLMDLGVGFYIVVHSMKLIRNSPDLNENNKKNEIIDDLINLPKRILKELKSSSILILIGIMRLISLKSTNYVEHESEYGIHWNFLFTIVLVKLLACPVQIFVRNSSLRSFIISLAIAFNYQYFLTTKNFTSYLLSNSKRITFLDANKEGIYSCVGYLAIYLGSQAICLRLSSILNKKKPNEINLKICFECVVNLICFVLFYGVMLLVTTSRIQNVSRRLCNVSFMCYILFMSTLLLTFFMISIVMVTKLYSKTNTNKIKEIISKLSETFSFAEISDAKYIGLIIFLLSNVLTGCVNLSINTLRTSDLNAFLILSAYSFVSFALPFLVHYYLRLCKKSKSD